MAGEDKHSKKHPASDKKKKDLKKKGQTPKSQDVPMAFGLIAAFLALLSMKNMMIARFDDVMHRYIGSIKDVGTPQGIDVGKLCFDALIDISILSAPVLFAVVFMALISNVAQTGLILTGEQLKPDIKKLNPMTKLKQWFSIKSLQELFKSLAKIVVASFLGWVIVKNSSGQISEAVTIESAQGLMMLGAGIIKKLFMYIIILYLVVAIVDFAFQRKNFNNDNKMTDKEVKDEYKNSEGDPYMKQKRRQIAQQIAMSPAQDIVPQGDVVIVNPTQLAIVLKYDPDVSPVPWVIAMGELHDADEIRYSARGAGVPVVRNKPLARALYELCEVGDIVPEDLYRPVAEVLSYVFQLKEQMRIDSSDAAAAASQTQQLPGAPGLHVSDAAAAVTRIDGGDDEGVHDLGVVQVPVITSGSVAAGAAGAAPATSGLRGGDDRFSWMN
ncbi:MAG: EscU/YscU/HrcU family type III secretion system export apparatus switch protein [Thermoleophilia bacterium]|nr:EscU/YscU/HrcU family type III secretion system export apparatus switch protein [Thermoleophilia bacterium]